VKGRTARLTIRRGFALREVMSSRPTPAEVAVGQSVILVIGSVIALLGGEATGSIVVRFLVAVAAACLGILAARRAQVERSP
jgi:zinc transporter ZupT